MAMKKKEILFIIIVLGTVLGLMYVFVNIMNADLSGRLIESISLNNESDYNRPIGITLVLHRYASEENSIEVSGVINYNNTSIFQYFESDTINLMVTFGERFSYFPSGLTKTFYFTDFKSRETHGYTNSGFETDRFFIPVAPSINFFPFDDLRIKPNINLRVNDSYSPFHLKVQKRIPGRTISESSEDKMTITLTRTLTEKYLVVISSIVFFLLNIILTSRIIKTKKGLNTVEGLIAVAGYILASASFKDLLGINRNSGTSTLEILVILVPLLLIFFGLIYSLFKNNESRLLN